MITMKCRFAEIFTCAIDENDFKQLQLEGLKGNEVYNKLDGMHYVLGGITSHNFVFGFDDQLTAQTINELADHFIVQIRPPLDLTGDAVDESHKLVIVENSKIQHCVDSISIDDKDRITFEMQQVILGGDLELILIFPKIDGVYLDLSDDVLMESFSGILNSKTLGEHEFDIA